MQKSKYKRNPSNYPQFYGHGRSFLYLSQIVIFEIIENGRRKNDFQIQSLSFLTKLYVFFKKNLK